MEELIKLLIGIFILILGIPIGNFLKSKTKDEMEAGKKWFKLLVSIGLFGGFVGLIIEKDWMMFFFFFMALVTSRSLITEKKN